MSNPSRVDIPKPEVAVVQRTLKRAQAEILGGMFLLSVVLVIVLTALGAGHIGLDIVIGWGVFGGIWLAYYWLGHGPNTHRA
jgi:hypothetical protein